ncbi:DUF4258 domain-containing protein [Scytonema sp. UIC 10036]|uniref:DUF4258 domain-containing protein n=1 Tax=Scytonema sp. UIC 10036 TaxID=2304196 RepID=UPI0012DAE1D2|nr:DUF4258 domain-containing protein [Scytonema sp. UIC 10036]MUG92313.1 DUF4258 domain-containing protein [Scytonema sp. UIC 10036]
MDTKKRLTLIFEADENKYKVGTLEVASRHQYDSHLQRRLQQRSINEAMIKITLLYGKKQFRHGAILFTLNDKSLHNTFYSQFTDALRGLRVVCLNGIPNPQILTVYWHKDTKQRLRW